MSYNDNPYDDYANSAGSSGLVQNHTISNYVIKTSLENLKAQELLKTETQALLEAIKDKVDTIDPIEFPNIPSALVSTDRFAIYRVDDSKYTLSYSTLLSEIVTSLGESFVQTATYNAFVATIGSAANQEASYFATASALATLSSNVSLKANAADVYTQTQLDVSLGLKANSADVYTQSELDTAFALKANQATTYTKAETDAAIAALVASAPGTLDTLNELAAALGDDPNFATTIASQIAGKADIATSLAGYGIVNAYTITQTDNAIAAAIVALTLGSAAQANTGDFATAAQGALADSAIQVDDLTAALASKANSADVYTQTQIDTALNLKADQTTTYTKAETDAAIAALVESAPSTLNTLNELAAALGDDPNFATTIAAQIAGKANVATSLAGYGIVNAYTITQTDNAIAAAITALALGTAAQANTGDFATAAQGVLADNALAASLKGAADGVAELDESGKLPSDQLPDDVAALPAPSAISKPALARRIQRSPALPERRMSRPRASPGFQSMAGPIWAAAPHPADGRKTGAMPAAVP